VTANVATWRTAHAEDEPFLREVYRATRAWEFAVLRMEAAALRALLDSQFDLQAAGYRRDCPGAVFSVICCDGQPAGRMIHACTEDGLLLMDIALAPAFRNRGLGTQVLRRLQEEARSASLKMVLHVEKGNPALALYQRLGFRVTGSDALRCFMQWNFAEN
jgi:ribosomal protein S18 acetylase RimI-like enzyme